MKLAIAFLCALGLVQAAPPEMTVYKTKTCGCCGKWVEHLRANGFKVTVNEVTATAEYQRKFGVPTGLVSCHTGVVNGYTVEGHVPAADIHRLLKEKPKAKGIAVPGMPMGSPGMEGAYSDSYATMLFTQDGAASVFQKHPGSR